MAKKPNIYYRKWNYDHGVVEDIRQPDSLGYYMGDDDDWYIRHDGTDVDVIAAADDQVWKWGDGTYSIDMWWYGNTSSDNIILDASANTLKLDGIDLTLEDSDHLYFGDDNDVDVRWDGTDLDILALADDQVIKFGTGTNSFDIWIYGNTSSDYVEFDASSNTWNFGQDDHGLDVYFYGATASAYMLWDETNDALVTAGVAHLHLGGIDADAGEGVGSVIQMGTSGTPLTSAEDETELLSCYFDSTGKNAYGMRMQVTKTSVSAGAPRVLTLRAILGHTTGFGPQGANAVDARVTLDKTGNTGISGEMHAMESQCRVEDESRTIQGTYAAHKFTNNFQTGNTMPGTTTFFLRFVDEGAVKTPLMFDFNSCTAGASNCVVANTAALQTTAYYLRVITPDGALGYIPIAASLG